MLQFDAQVGVVLAGEVSHVLDGPFADLTPLPCELDDIVQVNITRGSGGEGPPPGEGRPGIRPRETTTDWDMLQTLKGLRLWDSLPENIQKETDKASFKKRIATHPL